MLARVPVTPPGKVQFNVSLPTDLVRRVKHAAIDADLSLSAFTEQLFAAHLAAQEEES